MRTTIKAVFPDREAAVMVRPAMHEADLQRLDTLPYASLRPEFKQVCVPRLAGCRQERLRAGGRPSSRATDGCLACSSAGVVGWALARTAASCVCSRALALWPPPARDWRRT